MNPTPAAVATGSTSNSGHQEATNPDIQISTRVWIGSCSPIVANRYVADGIQRAGQQINAGESLSNAFQNLGMFPPLVIRMLRVGETTGALDTALMNVTYFYNRDVRDSVDKALKLLEPTLTLVLGGMLALILFSVLTPIYDIIGKIKF